MYVYIYICIYIYIYVYIYIYMLCFCNMCNVQWKGQGNTFSTAIAELGSNAQGLWHLEKGSVSLTEPLVGLDAAGTY